MILPYSPLFVVFVAECVPFLYCNQNNQKQNKNKIKPTIQVESVLFDVYQTLQYLQVLPSKLYIVSIISWNGSVISKTMMTCHLRIQKKNENKPVLSR